MAAAGNDASGRRQSESIVLGLMGVTHPKHRFWVCGAGVVLAAVAAVIASGVSAASAVSVLTFVSAGAVCFGRLWARLEPASSSLERLGAGLVLGQLLVVAVSQAGRVWLSTPAQLACAVAALLIVGVFGMPLRAEDESVRLRTLPVVLIALPALLGIVMYWRIHPLDFARPTTFFVDTPHLEAMSRGISMLGPADSIFIAADPTRYHWLVYGWIGALDSWFGADPFVIQTRISPLVALVGAVLIVPSLVSFVSTRALAPYLAVALITSSTVFFRADIGHHLSEVSPSNSVAMSWLLLATVVFVRRSSEASINVQQSAVLFVLAVATTAGKVSHGVVLLGGVMAWVIFKARSPGIRGRVMPAAVVSAGVVSSGILFVAGGESMDFGVRLGLNSDLPGYALPVWAVLRLIAWLPRWVGLLFVVSDSPTVSTARVVSFGMAATGLAGFFFTGQDDGANMFFVLAASGVVSIFSAGGLAEVLTKARADDRSRIIAVAVGVAVVGTVWMLRPTQVDSIFSRVANDGEKVGDALTALVAVSMTLVLTTAVFRIGRKRRAVVQVGLAALVLASVLSFAMIQTNGFLRGLQDWDALRVRQGEAVWSAEQHEAALWLREADADPAERVVTNRFCEQEIHVPPDCAGPRTARYFWVAAVAGRPMFVEGPVFSFGYGKIPERVVDRVKTSVRFASAPNSSDHEILWASGVRWAWLDLTQPSATDWDGFGSVAFENEAVRVVRLIPPGT